jgi:outer membrane protein TolC
VPGILLARIAHDQARFEFERRVHDLLFAVEEAYWDLYGAYWDLYSRESGLRLTHALWQTARAKFKAGGISQEELAQIEEQFHFFRSQRLEALGRGTPGRPQSGVLEAERRLRYVLGLPPEDGTRLVPSDAPVTTPVEPDWRVAVTDALGRRPELVQANEEIRAARLAELRAKDFLLPDLRFISRYDINGLGGTFGSSIRNLGQDPFPSWEMRLQMQVPLGFREGHAEVRRAQLLVAQRYAFLRDQESKVLLSLQRSYRDLVQFREEMVTRRSQREAAAVQVKVLDKKVKAGGGNIDLLLRAQLRWADALRDEYVAVCNYNIALADFERQKGTIMAYDNVALAESPLPTCAQERASAHIREFNHSLVLKECSPLPCGRRGGASEGREGVEGLPGLMDFSQPPALPLLEKGAEVPEKLEKPR